MVSTSKVRLLNGVQLARALGISDTTVSVWRLERGMPAVKVGGSWMYDADAVRLWAKDNAPRPQNILAKSPETAATFIAMQVAAPGLDGEESEDFPTPSQEEDDKTEEVKELYTFAEVSLEVGIPSWHVRRFLERYKLEFWMDHARGAAVPRLTVLKLRKYLRTDRDAAYIREGIAKTYLREKKEKPRKIEGNAAASIREAMGWLEEAVKSLGE